MSLRSFDAIATGIEDLRRGKVAGRPVAWPSRRSQSAQLCIDRGIATALLLQHNHWPKRQGHRYGHHHRRAAQPRPAQALCASATARPRTPRPRSDVLFSFLKNRPDQRQDTALRYECPAHCVSYLVSTLFAVAGPHDGRPNPALVIEVSDGRAAVTIIHPSRLRPAQGLRTLSPDRPATHATAPPLGNWAASGRRGRRHRAVSHGRLLRRHQPSV